VSEGEFGSMLDRISRHFDRVRALPDDETEGDGSEERGRA